MALVEVRPGDEVKLLLPTVMEGEERTVKVTYDELTRRIAKNDRKSSTKGSKFSRRVSMVKAGLARGAWSTGGSFDKQKSLGLLVEAVNGLEKTDYRNITPKAVAALDHLSEMQDIPETQRRTIKNLVDAINSCK